jgi:hypothetical protein
MEMNIVPIIITAKRYSKIKANKKKIKFNSIIIHNFSKVISNAAVLKNPNSVDLCNRCPFHSKPKLFFSSICAHGLQIRDCLRKENFA